MSTLCKSHVTILSEWLKEEVEGRKRAIVSYRVQESNVGDGQLDICVKLFGN